MEQQKNKSQDKTAEIKEVIDYVNVGRVVSEAIIMDTYEMAKLDVEKTEQAFDRISSKASVLMGLMVTVALALISAFAACMVRNPEDLTTLICAAATLLSIGASIFMISYGVLSDKSLHTTGEAADFYLNDQDVDWYKSQSEESRDNAFFAMKAGSLKYRSEANMELLHRMAKWYRCSIRLFVCSIAVIGIIYMSFQIFLEVC